MHPEAQNWFFFTWYKRIQKSSLNIERLSVKRKTRDCGRNREKEGNVTDWSSEWEVWQTEWVQREGSWQLEWEMNPIEHEVQTPSRPRFTGKLCPHVRAPARFWGHYMLSLSLTPDWYWSYPRPHLNSLKPPPLPVHHIFQPWNGSMEGRRGVQSSPVHLLREEAGTW